MEKKQVLLNEGAVQRLMATKKRDAQKGDKAAVKEAAEKLAQEKAQASLGRLPVKMQRARMRMQMAAEAEVQAARNRTELTVALAGALRGVALVKRVETGWLVEIGEDMVDEESWVRLIGQDCGDQEWDLTEDGKFVSHAKELETMQEPGVYRLSVCVLRDNPKGALAAMLAGSLKSQ